MVLDWFVVVWLEGMELLFAVQKKFPVLRWFATACDTNLVGMLRRLATAANAYLPSLFTVPFVVRTSSNSQNGCGLRRSNLMT